MHISLRTLQDEPIALVPVTTDEHGNLCATHPTLYIEVEIALYTHLEAGVDADTIDDADGVPYMMWRIIPAARLAWPFPSRNPDLRHAIQ